MKIFLISFILFSPIQAKLLVKQKFSNRFIIKDKLLNIFGPGSEEIINKNYFFAGSFVAGPCDYYEQVFHKLDKPRDPNTRCLSGKVSTKDSLYASDTPLRSAALAKTCLLLTEEPKLLEFSTSSKSPTLKLAYKNFYPFGRGENYFELLKPSKKSSSVFDYKKVMLSLCLSPDWQRP